MRLTLPLLLASVVPRGVYSATYPVPDFATLRLKAETPAANGDVLSLASTTYSCDTTSSCKNEFNMRWLQSPGLKFITIKCAADDQTCILNGEG